VRKLLIALHRWRRRSRGNLLVVAPLAAGAAIGSLRLAPPSPQALPPVPLESSVFAPQPAAPPPQGDAAPAHEPRHDAAATLAALRDRVAAADPRVPAAEVERWMLRLATEPRRRAGFEAGLARMGRFEPLIREALRVEGLPEALLYLPLVESAFQERAVSPAGAVGLWQFMPATARHYGLEVSEWVDERRDPVRSTLAAARHLRDLHRQFGSWHLALAAYNAGGPRVNAVLRAHARGERGDERLYWRVRPHLPRETRAYVPLFLASAELARNPAHYGFKPSPDGPLVYREVRVPGGVSLDAVARVYGLPVEDVRRLNPHLIRGSTPPGRPWAVRLPAVPPRRDDSQR
jgi:soluble lytic murein transglycosylase-like protein